jgi:predicted RNase H-like nuclease (RuvC/YqgF family)
MIFGNKELTEKAQALQTQLDEREAELETALKQRDELLEKGDKLDEALTQIETLQGKLTEAAAQIETLQAEVAKLPELANAEAIKLAAKAGHEPLEIAQDETTGTAPKTLSEALRGITDPVQAANIRRDWSRQINPTKTA